MILLAHRRAAGHDDQVGRIQRGAGRVFQHAGIVGQPVPAGRRAAPLRCHGSDDEDTLSGIAPEKREAVPGSGQLIARGEHDPRAAGSGLRSPADQPPPSVTIDRASSRVPAASNILSRAKVSSPAAGWCLARPERLLEAYDYRRRARHLLLDQ